MGKKGQEAAKRGMRSKTPRGKEAKGARVRVRAAPAAARSKTVEMTGRSPAGDLSLQLQRAPFFDFEGFPTSADADGNPTPSRFQRLLDFEGGGGGGGGEGPMRAGDVEEGGEEKDCILSQDFFCTPDYITPDGQQISNSFDFNKENTPCPKSPEKTVKGRNKRHKRGLSACDALSTVLPHQQQVSEVQLDEYDFNESVVPKSVENGSSKKRTYVPQSAIALRCRVMPPPCIKNPYIDKISSAVLDVFDNRRSKLTGFPSSVSEDGLSRYHTDFHEIEQIGLGNFSRVFKALKRIDGCLYAVKQSIKPLRNDMERNRALMEVQALAALGSHENIVGYYTSWFESEQLYIQMELCDGSLSISKGQKQTFKGGEILRILYQMAKALHFMHERGIAHLDVKPENIYVKNSVYKLGDLGCATLIDRSLSIEEGDSRYMPQEMLNDKYEHLDKVDIFSLGAATYEIVKGTPLPDSGPLFSNLREGKIPLLPGYPMQFQILLKAMMDPDPVKRPSAKELLEHPIFDRSYGGFVGLPR